MEKVGNQAAKEGYPASIAKEIFKTIMLQSKVYERNFIPAHGKT